MLKTRIKASPISNLTDARYFAAREVEWLGFCLENGLPDFCPPQQVMAIKEWVEGPRIVGEFGLQNPEDIKAVVDYLDLDAVQLNQFADFSSVRQQVSVPLIQEIIIESTASLPEFSPEADIYLLDFTKNNISWNDLSDAAALSRQQLVDWCEEYRILLAIDIARDDLIDFLDTVTPYGLNLRGGEEEKVGFKSFEELDDILDVLEVEGM